MDLVEKIKRFIEPENEKKYFNLNYWQDSQRMVELFLFYDLLNSARQNKKRKAVRLNVQFAIEIFRFVNESRCGVGVFTLEQTFIMWRNEKNKSFVIITFEDVLNALNESVPLLRSAEDLFSIEVLQPKAM